MDKDQQQYGVEAGGRKPSWLTIRVRGETRLRETEQTIHNLSLHTVCSEATCPNRLECFGSGTATFMILGSVCSRNCAFCDVETGRPSPPDHLEPQRVAEAVNSLGLRHAVVTSVTRDDLPDGGASLFAETITQVRKINPGVTIEVLIPDFQGDDNALRRVVDAAPDVINHNVETVPRLYPAVRPQARYERSLELLRRVKEHNPAILTKSGLMLGMGERKDEILRVLKDLRNSGCGLLTMGQYLPPSRDHHPVIHYVFPGIFEELKQKALALGFRGVASGPFVRSSYHASEMMEDTEKHPRQDH